MTVMPVTHLGRRLALAMRRAARQVWRLEDAVTEHNLDAWVTGTWVGMSVLFGWNLVAHADDFPAAGFGLNFRVMPPGSWGALALLLAGAVALCAWLLRPALVHLLMLSVVAFATWTTLAALSSLERGVGPGFGAAITWLALLLAGFYHRRDRIERGRR